MKSEKLVIKRSPVYAKSGTCLARVRGKTWAQIESLRLRTGLNGPDLFEILVDYAYKRVIIEDAKEENQL